MNIQLMPVIDASDVFSDHDPLDVSTFVPLSDCDLDTLLALACLMIGKNCDLEESVAPLSGGYVFVSNGEKKFYPQCYCDLSTITEWTAACECRSQGWESLWIGYPFLYVRSANDDLLINDAMTDDGAVKVPRSELISAVRCARIQIDDFRKQIHDILLNIIPHYLCHDVSHALVYGWQ